MKQVMMAVSFFVLSAVSAVSFAKSTNIAVVDLQKIMQTAPEMKTIKQDLEKKFSPRRDKLVKMEEQIKDDMQKLNRDAAVMSKSETKELQKKISQGRQEFEKEGQSYQQDLSTAHNKAMQLLYKKVTKVIGTIAKKQKYDLVLQKDAAPYSADKLDITDKVLDGLK